jgi:hypothetical protein
MTFGGVVLWLFSAIGAVTAVVQIWKWVHGRRAERGLARLLESYVDQEEAEATRAELHRLEQTLRDLRVRAPEIARRMHLEQRRRDLADTIGRAWAEYVDLGVKLDEPDPAGGLPEDIVTKLRTEIEPLYELEQRERRRTRILLVLVVAALVLPAPFTPQSLLYLIVNGLSAVLLLPDGIGGWVAYISGVVVTALGLAGGLALGWWIALYRPSLQRRRPWLAVSVVTGLFVVLGDAGSFWITLSSLGWGYVDRTAAGVNAVAGSFAAISGCCLGLAGVRPQLHWQNLLARLTRSWVLNNRS